MPARPTRPDGHVAWRARREIASRAATFCSSFALITVVAFADGGYFPEAWLWTTLALACLVWVVLLLRDEIVLGLLDLAAVAAVAVFVGWVGTSALWSPDPHISVDEAERGFVYVAAVMAFVLVVDRRRIRQHLAGVVTSTTLVATYAIGDRLIGDEGASDPTQGTLLIEPLGYANALGILCVLGVLISLGLALQAGSRRGRALWLAPAGVLLPALVLTESRGGWIALVVGLWVLLLFERANSGSLLGRRTSGALAAGLAVAALLGGAVAVVRADSPLGQRADYWRVAWNQWEENTWVGAGAGTFARYWQGEDTPVFVLDAHNLYVETLAELGLVGLLLLLCALGVPASAALIARRERSVAIGASGYASYLVHAGLDWDWEMPALTLAGLLCGVALLVASREATGAVALGAEQRTGFAFAALVVALLALAAGLAREGSLERGNFVFAPREQRYAPELGRASRKEADDQLSSTIGSGPRPGDGHARAPRHGRGERIRQAKALRSAVPVQGHDLSQHGLGDESDGHDFRQPERRAGARQPARGHARPVCIRAEFVRSHDWLERRGRERSG